MEFIKIDVNKVHNKIISDTKITNNSCRDCQGEVWRPVDYHGPPPRRPLTPPLEKKKVKQLDTFDIESVEEEEDDDDNEFDDDDFEVTEAKRNTNLSEAKASGQKSERKPVSGTGDAPETKQVSEIPKKEDQNNTKAKKSKSKKKKPFILPKFIREILHRKRIPRFDERAYPPMADNWQVPEDELEDNKTSDGVETEEDKKVKFSISKDKDNNIHEPFPVSPTHKKSILDTTNAEEQNREKNQPKNEMKKYVRGDNMEQIPDHQLGKLDEATLRRLELTRAWCSLQHRRFLAPRFVRRDASPSSVLAHLRQKAGIQVKKTPGPPYKEPHGPVVARVAWRGPEPAGWGCGCPGLPCLCYQHATLPPKPIPKGGREEGRGSQLWARLEARLEAEYRLHEKLRDLPAAAPEHGEMQRPLFCLGLDRCFAQRAMRRQLVAAEEARRAAAARAGRAADAARCARACRRNCTIDYSETVEALRQEAMKEALATARRAPAAESPGAVCAERRRRRAEGAPVTPLPLRCFAGAS